MKKALFHNSIFLLFLFISATSCEPKDEIIGPISPSAGELAEIEYAPTAYAFDEIAGLPPIEVPQDNPVTNQGVRLGRYLFYEKALSIDYSISCGSCHQQDKAFTDGQAVAIGVGGATGPRNSMSLINVGYNWKQNSANNFNWDGRFRNLEDQVLEPVENPLEMMNSWEVVEQRLREHEHYPRLFRQAFGILTRDQITKELAAKALAQFLRTLNSADSEYDRDEWVPFSFMNEAAQRGRLLFIGDAAGLSSSKDAECGHCHNFTRNFSLFASNDFSNNGIDSVDSYSEFNDFGLGALTAIPADKGTFREVSLRNIALTAPYMHDGRFSTLEEVIDHYVDHSTDNDRGPNVSAQLTSSNSLATLTTSEKADLLAFLHALTDTSYVNKAEWSDPFLLAEPWEE